MLFDLLFVLSRNGSLHFLSCLLSNRFDHTPPFAVILESHILLHRCYVDATIHVMPLSNPIVGSGFLYLIDWGGYSIEVSWSNKSNVLGLTHKVFFKCVYVIRLFDLRPCVHDCKSSSPRLVSPVLFSSYFFSHLPSLLFSIHVFRTHFSRSRRKNRKSENFIPSWFQEMFPDPPSLF